ncbi:MAG: SDR family NAD(P)-dependent oxidoreductase [Reyranellaceae bacterium]
MTSDEASLFGLTGKVALVVGGGAGIGEATSRLFARVGCAVVVLDRDLAAARAVAGAIAADGGKALPVHGDVLDGPRLAAAVAEADAWLDGIDVMVSVVGQASWGSLLSLDRATWQRDHDINLFSMLDVCRTVAGAMIRHRRPGTIAVVGSVSGMQSSPNHGAYGAAKAGLVQLVKTMAVEWAEHHIRVNCVAPGSIATPRLPETPERTAEFMTSRVPIRRRGKPNEVAGALLFLSSSMATYITGHTLMVDGGWMAANLRNMPGKVP